MAGKSVVVGGHSRWRIAGWGTAAALLLLPLVAMQVGDEVAWGVEDFVAAALLVGSVGIGCELAVRQTASAACRAAFGVALAGAFVLAWANLAVGIVGSEEEPANLMFWGVLAVGILGAAMARFRPEGMARAMVATALAQALAGVVALAAGWIVAVPATLFFATFWLGSAWLFRNATRKRPPA